MHHRPEIVGTGTKGQLVVAIILIIFAITMPRIAPLLQATHKTTVVANLQTLNNELSAYRMICGGYPEQLGALKDSAGKGCSSDSGAHSRPMIPNGYHISYTATRPDENGVYSGYTLTADPFSSGTAGIRSYFTDQTGIIRAHSGGRADASDPPLSP